ncbi:MAG: aromatic amino acid lyase, partial [Gammaproteobacteria bacterium]|nr:aromatic amino acid lyase [Gammaproteobacteria bacterium]
GAGDNPVVLPERNEVVSTGNFQMPLLTVALDAAGQALAHVAVGAVGRCARLLSGEQAGLPLNLARQRPHGAGFAPLMKTAEALLAEIRHDAGATIAVLSATSGGVEDTVVNAPLAAKKLQCVVAHLEQILAIETLVAAQAIDLAGVREVLPENVAAAHAAVRDRIPGLDRDRPMGEDVERVVEELVRTGILASPGRDG